MKFAEKLTKSNGRWRCVPFHGAIRVDQLCLVQCCTADETNHLLHGKLNIRNFSAQFQGFIKRRLETDCEFKNLRPINSDTALVVLFFRGQEHFAYFSLYFTLSGPKIQSQFYRQCIFHTHGATSGGEKHMHSSTAGNENELLVQESRKFMCMMLWGIKYSEKLSPPLFHRHSVDTFS